MQGANSFSPHGPQKKTKTACFPMGQPRKLCISPKRTSSFRAREPNTSPAWWRQSCPRAPGPGPEYERRLKPACFCLSLLAHGRNGFGDTNIQPVNKGPGAKNIRGHQNAGADSCPTPQARWFQLSKFIAIRSSNDSGKQNNCHYGLSLRSFNAYLHFHESKGTLASTNPAYAQILPLVLPETKSKIEGPA